MENGPPENQPNIEQQEAAIKSGYFLLEKGQWQNWSEEAISGLRNRLNSKFQDHQVEDYQSLTTIGLMAEAQKKNELNGAQKLLLSERFQQAKQFMEDNYTAGIAIGKRLDPGIKDLILDYFFELTDEGNVYAEFLSSHLSGQPHAVNTMRYLSVIIALQHESEDHTITSKAEKALRTVLS